jgi:hypothetical protein
VLVFEAAAKRTVPSVLIKFVGVDMRGVALKAGFFLPRLFASAIEAGVEGINVNKLCLISFSFNDTKLLA